MNLKAKPIINNQYWVITDGQNKVGNVIAEGTGYEVKLGENIEHYDSTKTITKIKNIRFEPIVKSKINTPPFAIYPSTGNKVYNSILDVKKRLHLYTKTAKSKCFYVAGWFVVKQNDEFQLIFCPKYIFIQRYEYKGPFKTEDEAKNSINIV